MQSWLQKKIRPLTAYKAKKSETSNAILSPEDESRVNDPVADDSSRRPAKSDAKIAPDFFAEFKASSADFQPSNVKVEPENESHRDGRLSVETYRMPTGKLLNSEVAAPQSQSSNVQLKPQVSLPQAPEQAQSVNPPSQSPILFKLHVPQPRLGLVEKKQSTPPPVPQTVLGESPTEPPRSRENAQSESKSFVFGLKPKVSPTDTALSHAELRLQQQRGLTSSRNMLTSFKVNLSRCLNTSDGQDRAKQFTELLTIFQNSFLSIPPEEWNDRCFVPFSNMLGFFLLQTVTAAAREKADLAALYSFSDSTKLLYPYLGSLKLLSRHLSTAVFEPLEKSLPEAFITLFKSFIVRGSSQSASFEAEAEVTDRVLCSIVKRDIKLAKGFLENDMLLDLLGLDSRLKNPVWQRVVASLLKTIFVTIFTTSHRALEQFQQLKYLEKMAKAADRTSKSSPYVSLLLSDLCISILKPALDLQNFLLLNDFNECNGYLQLASLLKRNSNDDTVINAGFAMVKELLSMGQFDSSYCAEYKELPFQFDDLYIPPINTKLPLLQNQQALEQIVHSIIMEPCVVYSDDAQTGLSAPIKAADPATERLQQRSFDLLFKALDENGAGYFTVANLQLPSQWVQGLNQFPLSVQKKIYAWLTYAMQKLQVVPVRELSILFSFVGHYSAVCSDTRLLVLEFIESSLSGTNLAVDQVGKWKSKFEELGLLNTLAEAFLSQVKFLHANAKKFSPAELQVIEVTTKCLSLFITSEEKCLLVKALIKDSLSFGLAVNVHPVLETCVLSLTLQMIRVCSDLERQVQMNKLVEMLNSIPPSAWATKVTILEELSACLASEQQLQISFFNCNGFQALMSILAMLSARPSKDENFDSQARMAFAATKTLISAVRHNQQSRAYFSNNKAAIRSITSAITQAPLFCDCREYESLGLGLLAGLAVESSRILEYFNGGLLEEKVELGEIEFIEHPEFLVEAVNWLPRLESKPAVMFLNVLKRWLEVPFNAIQLSKLDLLAIVTKLKLRDVSLEPLVKKWLSIRFTSSELRTMLQPNSNFSFLFTVDALRNSLENQVNQPYYLQFCQDFSGISGCLETADAFPTAKPFPPLNGYTFLVWIKIELLDDNYPIKILSITNGEAVKLILQVENKASGKLTITTPKGTVRFDSTMLPVNTWFHLAFTHVKPRLTASQAYLYINGQLAEQLKCSYIGSPLAVNSVKIMFGDDNFSTGSLQKSKAVWYLSSALFINEEMLDEAALAKWYKLGVDYHGMYLSNQLHGDFIEKSEARSSDDDCMKLAIDKDRGLTPAKHTQRFLFCKPLFHFSAQNTLHEIAQRHYPSNCVPIQVSLSRMLIPGFKGIWNSVYYGNGPNGSSIEWPVNPAMLTSKLSVGTPAESLGELPQRLPTLTAVSAGSTDQEAKYKVSSANFVVYREHMPIHVPQRAVSAIEQMGGMRALLKLLALADKHLEVCTVLQVIEVYLRQCSGAKRERIVYTNQYLHNIVHLLCQKVSVLESSLVQVMQTFFFDEGTNFLSSKQLEAIMLHPSSCLFWRSCSLQIKAAYLDVVYLVCRSSEANAQALNLLSTAKLLLNFLGDEGFSSLQTKVFQIISCLVSLNDVYYDEKPLKAILQLLLNLGTKEKVELSVFDWLVPTSSTKYAVLCWIESFVRQQKSSDTIVNRLTQSLPVNLVALTLYPCLPTIKPDRSDEPTYTKVEERHGRITLSLLKLLFDFNRSSSMEVEEATQVVSSQLFSVEWALVTVVENTLNMSASFDSIASLRSSLNPTQIEDVNQVWLKVLLKMVQNSVRAPHAHSEKLLELMEVLFFQCASFERAWVKNNGLEVLIEPWHLVSPKKSEHQDLYRLIKPESLQGDTVQEVEGTLSNPFTNVKIKSQPRAYASQGQRSESYAALDGKPLPKTPSAASLASSVSFIDLNEGLESPQQLKNAAISRNDLTDALEEDVGFVFVGSADATDGETAEFSALNDDSLKQLASSLGNIATYYSSNIANSASSSRRGSASTVPVLPESCLTLVKRWLVRYFSLQVACYKPSESTSTANMLEKILFAVSRFSKDLDYKTFQRCFLLEAQDCLVQEMGSRTLSSLQGLLYFLQILKVAMVDLDCFNFLELFKFQELALSFVNMLEPGYSNDEKCVSELRSVADWLTLVVCHIALKLKPGHEQSVEDCSSKVNAWLSSCQEVVNMISSLRAKNAERVESSDWIKQWLCAMEPLIFLDDVDGGVGAGVLNLWDLLHQSFDKEVRDAFAVTTSQGKGNNVKIDGLSLYDGLFVQRSLLERQVFQYWLDSMRGQMDQLFLTFYNKFFSQQQDREKILVKNLLKERFQVQVQAWQMLYETQNSSIVVQKLILQHLYRSNKQEEAKLQRFTLKHVLLSETLFADFAASDLFTPDEMKASLTDAPMRLDFTETRYRMRNKLKLDSTPRTYVSKAVKMAKSTNAEPEVPLESQIPNSIKLNIQSQQQESLERPHGRGVAVAEEDSKPPPVPEKDVPQKNKSKVFRKWIDSGEQPLIISNVGRVTGLDVHEGLLLVTENVVCLIDGVYYQESSGNLLPINKVSETDRDVYIAIMEKFASPNFSAPNREGVASKLGAIRSRKWHLADVREIHKRLFLQRQVAMEIFLFDGQSELIMLRDQKQRDHTCARLWQLVTASKHQDVGVSSSAGSSGRTTGAISSGAAEEAIGGVAGLQATPQGIQGSRLQNLFGVSPLQELTDKWVKRELSNFQYLMYLNTLAGRSYNDLTQYPVFPWVLSNYSDTEIDLGDESNYRDLGKPMGALGELRAQKFRERFSLWDDPDLPPCHYGVHYSSAMIVCSYLIRLEPFTLQYVKLQGGHFDHPDRLFSSLERAYLSASEQNTNDVRELIPEFYYFPEFLENIRGLELGVMQDGTKVDGVILPPWAHGSSRLFVETMRRALESEYVSAHLNEWIDLIFGFKQQGDEAVNAMNTFHYLSYESAVDMDAITNQLDKQATVGIINNFGQTPRQLFKKPHPKRQPTSSDAANAFQIRLCPSLLLATSEYVLPLRTPPETMQLYNSLESSNLPSISAYAVNELFVVGSKLAALTGCKSRIPGTAQYVEWGFLDNSVRVFGSVFELGNDGRQPLAVLEQLHSDYVLKVQFADESTFVTAGSDQLLKLYKYNTKSLISTKQVSVTAAAAAAAVNAEDEDEEFELNHSAAGGKVAAKDSGKGEQNETKQTTVAKELKRCTLVATWRCHEKNITSLNVCRVVGVAVSGDEGGICHVWDLNQFCHSHVLLDLKGSKIVSISVNETYGTVAAATSSKVALWSVNGEFLCEFALTDDRACWADEIFSIAFCDVRLGDSVEDLVAVGTKRGSVRILSRQFSGENWLLSQIGLLEADPNRPLSSVTSIYVPRNPRVIIAGDVKGQSAIWTFPDGSDCEWHLCSSSNCEGCGLKFAVLDKRGHCKRCGLSYCHSCQLSFSEVIMSESIRSARACDFTGVDLHQIKVCQQCCAKYQAVR